VDEWAAVNPQVEVVLQIGKSEFVPKHANWVKIMDQTEYLKVLASCKLFVAHVGIGSIIQALEQKKQMLLMPRLAASREHTTDHQLHTAAKFKHYQGIKIVENPGQLKSQISELLKKPMVVSENLSTFAPEVMLDSVRKYLAKN
jgi:UDP-N-acetylglucosamine transferase subunit ALG13